MLYQKNHRIKILFVFFIIVLFVNVDYGQKMESTGYLFGHVGIDDPTKETWVPLANANIELEYKGKILKLLSNKAGLIDEILPKGKYRLLSVTTKNGIVLEFVSDQKKCFEIKANKERQFNIFLKPER